MRVNPMDQIQRGSLSEDEDEDEDDDRRIRGIDGSKSKFMRRDTNKIRTNPKYRCLDEGSEDENGVSKNNINDEQQQSSKEIQFRETFLRFESKQSV